MTSMCTIHSMEGSEFYALETTLPYVFNNKDNTEYLCEYLDMGQERIAQRKSNKGNPSARELFDNYGRKYYSVTVVKVKD